MHELGITQSVVDTVIESVEASRISVLRLEIGTLSGVVANSVRFCFELVAEGTALEGARLEIDEPRGQATCHDCEIEFEPRDPIALCPCGSANTVVTTGRSLRLRSVEVE